MQDNELVEQCKAAVEATGLLDGDEASDVVRAIIPIVQKAQRERDAAVFWGRMMDTAIRNQEPTDAG